MFPSGPQDRQPSFQKAANLPIVRHVNAVPTFLFNMKKIHFNIILPFMNKFSNWSISVTFIQHKPLWIPLLFPTLLVYHPSNFPRFGRRNIWLPVTIIMHFITLFYPAYTAAGNHLRLILSWMIIVCRKDFDDVVQNCTHISLMYTFL
jgi:hypothetical protein